MGSKAQKLLEEMHLSKANWKRRDLDSLYEGFGFIIRHGSSHDVIVHSTFKQLRTTLPRHGDEVLKSYVQIAVKLVDRLLELQQESNNEASKE
jgi:cold shock CspA family protein